MHGSGCTTQARPYGIVRHVLDWLVEVYGALVSVEVAGAVMRTGEPRYLVIIYMLVMW